MNIENATVEDVTKALIHFISARNSQPFWRYEYITKSVWTIKSAEQIDNFVQHILRVFEMSLPPNAHLGGFQLLDLIITELKSHMTCYNSLPLIDWNHSNETGEQIL